MGKRKRSYGRIRRLLWKRAPYCKICKKELRFDEATVDHIIALRDGGDNSIQNLQITCFTCNQEKD